MRFDAISSSRFPARRRLATAAAVGIVLSAVTHLALGQTGRGVPDAAGQARPSQADVRSLVNAVTTQLRLVYRDNLPEYSRRSEQLGDAIRAWNNSSHSTADRQQMTAWLRQAVRDSMPGSTGSLPPVPQFAPSPRVAEPAPRSVLRAAKDTHRESSSPTAAREYVSKSPETPQPARRQTAKPVVGRADVELLDDPRFWDRHPAAGQIPAQLSDGDPFLDDPLPTESTTGDQSSN
jgi:hypothetical protein